MEHSNPQFIMLVGVPAAGKSYFIEHRLSSMVSGETVIVSTDDIIEEHAASVGKTYNDVFSEQIGQAQHRADALARAAFAAGKNVVWDQTNTGKKVRAKRLKMAPANYKKIAVFFETPDQDEHRRRLNNRPGKTIPAFVIAQMIENLSRPSTDEGFDIVLDNTKIDKK